jgi:hypothetical protein
MPTPNVGSAVVSADSGRLCLALAERPFLPDTPRQIRRSRAIMVRFTDVAVGSIGQIATSGHGANLQIPIAQSPTLTAAVHPAVSSPEACPTPAR